MRAVSGGDGTEWTLDSDIYLTANSVSLYSYYPYSGTVQSLSSIPVETESQTDYMYGSVVDGLNADNTGADITLNHALTAFSLSFFKGGYTGTGNITSVSIESDILATAGVLDATDGSLSSLTGTGTAIGQNLGASLSATATGVDIMALPTGAQGTVTITAVIDGATFTATTAALTPEQGAMYQYSITLAADTKVMNVSQVRTVDWVAKDYTLPELEPELPWVTATYNVSQVAIDNNIAFMTGLYVAFGVYEITDLVDRMIVDGVETAVAETGFVTAGEHTVKFLFKDNTKSVPVGFFIQNFCLTRIEWKGSGWDIQSAAFYMCTGLKTVPDWHTMSSVGMGAFIYTGFEKLELPADWPTMDMMANNQFPLGFCTSPSMTSISVHPDNPLFYVPEGSNALMVRPDAVEGMEGFLYSGCPTTVIPENTAYIADYAFAGIYNPRDIDEMLLMQDASAPAQPVEVVLPESVLFVSTGAFSENFYLTSITFGSNVSVLVEPFSPIMIGCPALNTIVSRAETAPSFTHNGGVSDTGTLYVPQGATGYDTWIESLGAGWTLQTIE